MRGRPLLRETLVANFTILNDDHGARFERANLLETEVEQRHTLAGGGEQESIVVPGITQRPEAVGIAQHYHIAHRVEEHQVISAVELTNQAAKNLDQIGP